MSKNKVNKNKVNIEEDEEYLDKEYFEEEDKEYFEEEDEGYFEKATNEDEKIQEHYVEEKKEFKEWYCLYCEYSYSYETGPDYISEDDDIHEICVENYRNAPRNTYKTCPRGHHLQSTTYTVIRTKQN